MSSLLAGVTIAVLGGDDREVVLIPELLRLGARVTVAGNTKMAGCSNVLSLDTVEDAVRDAAFVILPIPGIDENGCIRAKYAKRPLQLNSDTMRAFRDDCVVIVGVSRKLLQELVGLRRLKLIEILEMDEVAVLNSVPSAEGAIQMAMEATDITIHGSNTIVFGFGRCGSTLARMVAGIGAKTSVAARKSVDLARISLMGLIPVTYKQLPELIGEADFIFNTVPSLVLDRKLLTKVKPSAYICDIASAPGGVDFAAAKEIGIRAELAPGLPGKVAPRTAGLILAKVIPDIIANELTGSSSSALK